MYNYLIYTAGMSTLNKMVEQYKNKAVELETEKFEILSSVQMRDQQVLVLYCIAVRAFCLLLYCKSIL